MSDNFSKIDVDAIRKEFPILHQKVNGKPLIYFDNAASSQKPKQVIDALSQYYQNDNANIHRGVHFLAEKATKGFEETRLKVSQFINSKEKEEIIFTKGTTESINLVAHSYGMKFIQKGDEILITEMEHHSNIVPWQWVCEQRGAILKTIQVTPTGELDLESFENQISTKTKIVALNYISNSLGTINPIAFIIKKAKEVGAVTFIDGAQASPHLKIDVQQLEIDFLAFSSHKMYGPTGVGILYGKRELLEKMNPYQGGGEMIKNVTFQKTTYNDIPYKFEAGTPNIGDVVAFKSAMEYIENVGIENIAQHEQILLKYATKQLNENITGLLPFGTASNKTGVISFNIEKIHPFDIGMMLDAQGIAVRTGHHCTEPLITKFKLEGTVRASFAVYNTINEIDSFVEHLNTIIKKLRK